MQNTSIAGYMYSFINPNGDEILLTFAFGKSKTGAKRRLKNWNHFAKIEPIKPHKIYKVVISIGDGANACRAEVSE